MNMEDPIVNEIHAIRLELYKQCNGDIDRMLEILREPNLPIFSTAVTASVPTIARERTDFKPEFAH
jgi:hypothetical protein